MTPIQQINRELYTVYMIKEDRTYGDYVYLTEALECAKLEAQTRKNATGVEYAVFQNIQVWTTRAINTTE